MKKTFIISLCVILFVAFTSLYVSAQPYYRNAPQRDGLYELNLSDQQIEKIQKLDMQLEKEITPMLSEMRSLFIKLDEYKIQREPDPQKIDELFDKIDQIEDSIRQKESQFYDNVRDLLTDEQKALFDSYYVFDDNIPRLGYGRYGCGWGPMRLRRGWGLNSIRPGRGLGRGYYGYGRNQGLRTWRNRYWRPRDSRYDSRRGYGRGGRMGRGRGWFGRYYHSNLYRKRFIW
ncbi:MAG: hypothetical protein GF421_07170 [Candidatus Aminicenantes bacterium]|nr:hypothetical protein [Candidatus Aminicenantes bacterium]